MAISFGRVLQQQEVREVGADYQHHKADGGGENEDGGTEAAANAIAQGGNHGLEVVLPRIRFRGPVNGYFGADGFQRGSRAGAGGSIVMVFPWRLISCVMGRAE